MSITSFLIDFTTISPLQIGISLTCLAVSLAFIAQMVREVNIRRLPPWQSYIRSRRRVGSRLPTTVKRPFRKSIRCRCLDYIDRSYLFPEYWRDHILINKSISKRVVSLVVIFASIIYGPFLTYVIVFIQLPEMLSIYGIDVSNIGGPTILIELLLLLFMILAILGSYISHMFLIDECLKKIIRPLLLPLSFYNQLIENDERFGKRDLIEIIIFRVSAAWFVLGSFYNIVFGIPVIVSEDFEQWMFEFGIAVFLPGAMLMWMYMLVDMEISRNRRDESDWDFAEWRSQYPAIDKIWRKLSDIILQIANKIGIATRASAARILSYWLSIITLLLLVAPFEYLLPQESFQVFVLPVIFSIILLIGVGILNSFRKIHTIGTNYVRSSRGEDIREENGDRQDIILSKSKFLRRSSEIGKNFLGAYLLFIGGNYGIAHLPLSLILYADSLAENISIILASDIISVIFRIPNSITNYILESVLQHPHPGKWLIFLIVNLPTYYMLIAAVHNTRDLHKEAIYYVFERVNPHERDSNTKESIWAMGRDIVIIYSLIYFVSLAGMMLALMIHLIFSRF